MSRTRRKFDKEFKLEATKMVVEGGKTLAEVGRLLGVNQGLIGKWVKAHREDGSECFPGNGKLKPGDEELQKLRKLVWDQQRLLSTIF